VRDLQSSFRLHLKSKFAICNSSLPVAAACASRPPWGAKQFSPGP
jgi:hypothetical protein